MYYYDPITHKALSHTQTANHLANGYRVTDESNRRVYPHEYYSDRDISYRGPDGKWKHYITRDELETGQYLLWCVNYEPAYNGLEFRMTDGIDEVRGATGLDDLLEIVQKLHEAGIEVSSDEMPKFGPKPQDTQELHSWDEHRGLFYDGSMIHHTQSRPGYYIDDLPE